MFDIVFLSYDEPACETNWAKLLKVAPLAKRVHGVNGLWAAHKACAEVSSTKNFFLVDGDAEVVDGFSFSFQHCSSEELETQIFLWRSVNPVNDLVNGNGAIKLVPRSAFSVGVEGLDMTTCVRKRFVRVDEVASVSRFNTSRLSAWRAGFRECAKLAGDVLDRGNEWERRFRLQQWCGRGADRPYGEWCIRGSIAGRRFGMVNRGDGKALALINDYAALERMFQLELESIEVPGLRANAG